MRIWGTILRMQFLEAFSSEEFNFPPVQSTYSSFNNAYANGYQPFPAFIWFINLALCKKKKKKKNDPSAWWSCKVNSGGNNVWRQFCDRQKSRYTYPGGVAFLFVICDTRIMRHSEKQNFHWLHCSYVSWLKNNQQGIAFNVFNDAFLLLISYYSNIPKYILELLCNRTGNIFQCGTIAVY